MAKKKKKPAKKGTARKPSKSKPAKETKLPKSAKKTKPANATKSTAAKKALTKKRGIKKRGGTKPTTGPLAARTKAPKPAQKPAAGRGARRDGIGLKVAIAAPAAPIALKEGDVITAPSLGTLGPAVRRGLRTFWITAAHVISPNDASLPKNVSVTNSSGMNASAGRVEKVKTNYKLVEVADCALITPGPVVKPPDLVPGQSLKSDNLMNNDPVLIAVEGGSHSGKVKSINGAQITITQPDTSLVTMSKHFTVEGFPFQLIPGHSGAALRRQDKPSVLVGILRAVDTAGVGYVCRIEEVEDALKL